MTLKRIDGISPWRRSDGGDGVQLSASRSCQIGVKIIPTDVHVDRCLGFGVKYPLLDICTKGLEIVSGAEQSAGYTSL